MAVMSQKTKGRLVLLGIVMVFLVPIGVAQLWVQHVQQRLEEGSAVRLSALHSDFLGPVRLGQWFPQDAAPDVLQRGTWTLLVWAPHSCTEACLRTVALTQRMQIALGRYAWRVQRVLMAPQPPQGSLEPYGRFEPLIVPQAKGSQWPDDQVVYLVDGQGQLVLRYRPGIEMDGFMADVRRLVAHSR